MGTRKSGRSGVLYYDMAGGGSASPVLFIANWGLDGSTGQLDCTSMDDSSKVYVPDVPDSKIAYEGFMDYDAPQFWLASQDGIARKWYEYPVRGTTTRYWYGTGFADVSYAGGVGKVLTIKGNVIPATPTQQSWS